MYKFELPSFERERTEKGRGAQEEGVGGVAAAAAAGGGGGGGDQENDDDDFGKRVLGQGSEPQVGGRSPTLQEQVNKALGHVEGMPRRGEKVRFRPSGFHLTEDKCMPRAHAPVELARSIFRHQTLIFCPPLPFTLFAELLAIASISAWCWHQPAPDPPPSTRLPHFHLPTL